MPRITAEEEEGRILMELLGPEGISLEVFPLFHPQFVPPEQP